jgi:hypothetical protein
MADVYDNAAVVLNGSVMSEATTVTISYETGDEVVPVLGGGSRKTISFAPGGRYMRVEFDLAVPVLGPDLDVFDRFIDVETVTLQVFLRGNGGRLDSQGWIMAPTFNAAVAQSANIHVSFVGEADTFT